MTVKSAKIKLTLWYLLIISAITVFFSSIVYTGVSSFTKRALQMQKVRMEKRFDPEITHRMNPPNAPIFEHETLEEIEHNLIIFLIKANTIIIGVSGVLGYLLAGRTLKPIEEMIEEQNRFISDAAHELKTPLTALKTEIEISLKEKILTPKNTKSILKSNLEEVNKLQKLSENLLKESRFSSNNDLNKKIEDISLDLLLEDILKVFKRELKKKDVEVKQNIEKVIIKGDCEGIREAITTILDNAIKYSDNNKSIFINVLDEKDSVKISIRDEGVGIPKDEQKLIFKRFYRSDPSRNKSKSDGFGLGLSIAKNIIENHNGKIELESEVNKGSEFIITLPKS